MALARGPLEALSRIRGTDVAVHGEESSEPGRLGSAGLSFGTSASYVGEPWRHPKKNLKELRAQRIRMGLHTYTLVNGWHAACKSLQRETGRLRPAGASPRVRAPGGGYE